MYLHVTWQINSENVSTFLLAVPSLLSNKIKIAITPNLSVSVSRSAESADADRSGDESLEVDLQYKNAHFSNSFHSVITIAT
jgi:hypothetical protein